MDKSTNPLDNKGNLCNHALGYKENYYGSPDMRFVFVSTYRHNPDTIHFKFCPKCGFDFRPYLIKKK